MAEQKILKEIANEYSGRKRDQVVVKASAKDIEMIDEKAAKYAGGNRSAWMRYASTKFNPSSSQLMSMHDEID